MSEIIEIDGSHGEGGGQIVRTAVSLSAVTSIPVRIINIRQGRPKPGLAGQHVSAIEALSRISSASTSGIHTGSLGIEFHPGILAGGSYNIDIGTAGSVTLLIQCLLPALCRANGTVFLSVIGGTDVKWAPTIDYLQHVALPAFELFGLNAKLRLLKRGYYPRGGGQVALEVVPGPLKPARLDRPLLDDAKSNNSRGSAIIGVSHCGGLPAHVAERQALAAEDELKSAGYDSLIDVLVAKCSSTGSGIALWSGFKGATAQGERGIRAEVVGKQAAKSMIAELRCSSGVDVHLADQLIPYLALAGGSFTVRELTMHTMTNIWTAGHFLKKKIMIEKGTVNRVEGMLE
jgi:RNA 3'-terminal phosphate cyclase (ATP)